MSSRSPSTSDKTTVTTLAGNTALQISPLDCGYTFAHSVDLYDIRTAGKHFAGKPLQIFSRDLRLFK